MMINYYTKVQSNQVKKNITIEDWFNLIRYENDNTQYIKDARRLTKDDKRYQYIKTTQLPCITPNFIYDKVKKDVNIIDSTGLMYIDIDLENETKATILKEELKSNELIYAMWLSLSSTGLALLVKVDGMNKNNFKKFYNSIDIDYDKNAVKKSQYNVLSYDPDIYINNGSVILKEEDNSLEEFFTPLEDELIFSPQIDVKENRLRTDMVLEEYGEDCVYIEEGKIYFECFTPFRKEQGKSVKVGNGNRNQVLSSFLNNLILLNMTSPMGQIVKFMGVVNNNVCNIPLPKQELYLIVEKHYNNKHLLKPLKPIIKRHWIDPEYKGDKNKLFHQSKKNVSLDKINNFFGDDILNVDKKITMKVIADYTGLCIITIKRRITEEQKEIYKELNRIRKHDKKK